MIVSIHPKDDLDNAVAILAAKGLGEYVLPAGVHLRPVTGSEKRVLLKRTGALHAS